MTRREMERQLNILEAQLMDVHSKSERMVCAEYNVDHKQEAIDILKDEIKMLEAQIDYYDNDDDTTPNWGGVDPAFSSLREYYQMRY